MISTYDRIAEEIAALVAKLGPNDQLLIGFAGPPGGGKSTTAEQVHRRVPHSVVVPMDGYHFTKEQLRQFPDPEAALARRGAHWTFDGEAFGNALQKLKLDKHGSFPAFEHGVGDPVQGNIIVEGPETHKVVLIEGNYLTLDIPPWDQITSILDFTYFIDCDLAVVEQRILKRHIAVNGNTPERALERVTMNDSPNAQLVLASKHRANAIIQSV